MATVRGGGVSDVVMVVASASEDLLSPNVGCGVASNVEGAVESDVVATEGYI